MNILVRGANQSKKVWGDQRGVTGLETAIVLIAFVVVAAVFAFTVITTGLFSSEKAGETAHSGLSEASTSLTPKGAVVATANAGKDAVATVKFKLTNSGAEAVGLVPANTLLTYTDGSNNVTLVRANDINGTGSTAPWWWSEWKLGTGDAVNSGEVVEITVGLFTAVDSTTTVNEGATYAAADVTLTVTDGTKFTVGDTIYIDQEQLSVTAIAVNDLTVGRGANSTTDAAHNDLGVIYIVNSQLPTNVGVNVPFKIELIPAKGAPFAVTRISPVEITTVMDLR